MIVLCYYQDCRGTNLCKKLYLDVSGVYKPLKISVMFKNYVCHLLLLPLYPDKEFKNGFCKLNFKGNFKLKVS